jgi:hypothetical protein
MRSQLMRYFSFPDEVIKYFHFNAMLLAKFGYYWKNGTVRCVFNRAHVMDIAVFRNVNEELPFEHDCDRENTHTVPDNPGCCGIRFMNYESHRLLSFLKARWDNQYVSARELAAAGFFYVGPNDASRCAFCPLTVDNWEEGDTAWGEHIRWYPDCPFMRGFLVGNFKLSVCAVGIDGIEQGKNEHENQTK